MIKKSLIQGLYIMILLYLAVIFLNILGIQAFDYSPLFSSQGMLLFYIFISIGTLMFMRI